MASISAASIVPVINLPAVVGSYAFNDSSTSLINVFNNERELSTADGMKQALEMAGVFLEEASLDFLYI